MNKLKVLSLLQAGRLLLEDRNNWRTGSLASDKDGLCLLASDKKAARWCAYGALYNFKLKYKLENEAVNLLRESSMTLFGKSPPRVNDDIGHAAVLKIYDHAIKHLDV